MVENAETAEVTASDILHALCYRAIEDPKGFNADTVKDTLTALGFGSIWEQAQEQVLMSSFGDAEDARIEEEFGASEGDESPMETVDDSTDA